MPDELLDCLCYLCRHFGVVDSPSTLTAGLPLVEGRLTPALLPKAAQNAGLAIQIETQTLSQLPDAYFPFIILSSDTHAWVALHYNAHEQSLTLYDPVKQQTTTKRIDPQSDTFIGPFYRLYHPYLGDARSEELSKKASSDFREHWFWSSLWQSRHLYRDVLLASFLINLLVLVVPLFSRLVYDKVLPNLAFDTLWVLSSGVVVALLFDVVFKLMRSHFVDLAAKKSDQQISSQLFAKALGIKMEARPASVGAFARHLQEFDSIRDFFTAASINALIDLPFTLLFLLVIWLLGGQLVYIPLIAAGILLCVALALRVPMRRSIEQAARVSTQKQAELVESLFGLESIKLQNAQHQAQRRWELAVNQSSFWTMKARRHSDHLQTIAQFMQQLSAMGLLVLGVYSISEGTLSIGALIAVTMLNGRAMAPLVQLALLTTRYQQVRSSLDTLNAVMALPDETTQRAALTGQSPLTGHIEFKQVSFHYPNQSQAVLSKLSFSIAAGEKVAILGRVGSGKSTLQRLITGLYQPSDGRLLFDQHNSQQYHPNDLRRQIGAIPQDPALFYGSIRDNITLGALDVTEEEIHRVIKLTGVALFTQEHSEGLGRQVGEGGRNLSGGQRQAIAIARALLNQPPILIMDEPTSAMDNRSEQTIKQALNNLRVRDTLILITHKISLLDVVDRILILDDGHLVADGPKQQVLSALKNGKIASYQNAPQNHR